MPARLNLQPRVIGLGLALGPSAVKAEIWHTDEVNPHPPPLILFDGVCNLCNASVQWVIRHDRRGAFRFASLQSRAGRQALEKFGAGGMLPDSVVLIDATGVHISSDAVIGIATRLGLPWNFIGAARIVPRVIRDGMYGWVARNRYRWFGRQNACMVPTPELRERFLDADEAREVLPGTDGVTPRDGA